MAHKIYGQQVLFIEGDNPIVASTPEEMFALLTSDNVGKFVKYIGETGDFNFSTPTGRNLPVNPVTVDHSVDKWYFDTSVVPDFAQFAWSDLSSSETESIILCTVAVPGTTSGDKYILKVDRFPKGSRFADGWSRLKEDAYTIRIPFTSPSFKGYVYVSTEELAYQIKHTGANPPQVHQGWMVKQGTWNINDYGWWVTDVSQQDVWGGYISKDGKWVAEVINTNLSLVKDAFYKISEEIDIARYIEVPILTNEGTAADLVSGKQLISSSGVIVTGTGPIETGNKLNQFFNKTIIEVTEDDLAGVTSIGNFAFSGCTSLTSVTIPDSVTSIGNSAFSGCTSLTSVTNPDSVTSIGDYAFSGCSSLTSVTIPDSVTSIGESTFNGCRSLTNITIPFVGAKAGVTSSDKYQYPFGYIFGASSYTGGVATKQYYHGGSTSSTTYSTYYIPSSLKSVTVTGGKLFHGAFYNCSGLTSITIPNSVTSISNSAFFKCSGLTSITIPDSVTSIGKDAFNRCTGLTSITIPNSVTSIGDYAFYGCTGLTSITIPNSVTSIGDYAFYGCTSLTSVTIPDSVTSIGSAVFNDCSNLEAVYITDLAKWLSINLEKSTQPRIFYRSYELYLNGQLVTDAVIPDSITRIGNYAFYGCTSLTSVTIPDSVTSIGVEAFRECFHLEAVYITDLVKWLSIEFATGGTATSNPLHRAHKLYLNGQLVTDVVIPDGITRIGDAVFCGCTSLTSVTIPDSVTRMGLDSFSGCSSLKAVYITDFAKWCAISFASRSNPLLYAHKLYLNGQLVTDAVIPDGITSIGNEAFSGCTSLTSVTIPDSVTSIDYEAFRDCTGLTSVTIPDSVTSISSRAFYCSGLISITMLSTTPPTLGSQAFDGPASSIEIIVPKGCGDTYKAATNWSKYADYIVEAAN